MLRHLIELCFILFLLSLLLLLLLFYLYRLQKMAWSVTDTIRLRFCFWQTFPSLLCSQIKPSFLHIRWRRCNYYYYYCSCCCCFCCCCYSYTFLTRFDWLKYGQAFSAKRLSTSHCTIWCVWSFVLPLKPESICLHFVVIRIHATNGKEVFWIWYKSSVIYLSSL